VRALIGGLLSIVVTLIARPPARFREAVPCRAIVGTVSFAAGWSWGALLFSFFASASALSKLGEQRKAERVGPVVDKSDERDFAQVLANGRLLCAAALGTSVAPVACLVCHSRRLAAGIGG